MPTSLIQKHIEELAKWLRNQETYDDWDYGTEVIPGDKTWSKKKCNNCRSCSCKMIDKDKN